MSCPAAAPRAATSSRSATNVPFVTPNNPTLAGQASFTFPKTRRLLRNSEFRKVYDEGFRIACPYFAAFCLRWAGPDGSRVGFTVPRSLGKSVVRNRMKRRMREAVRLHLASLGPGWAIVFNPRKALLDVSFDALEREVVRVFAKCGSAE